MAKEFEIRREVELVATPEQVWEAITTRQGLAGWLWDQEPTPEAFQTAWDPPRRLRIEIPPAENGATHAFEYLIEARGGGGARLRFVHSGFLGDDWEGEFDFQELTGHGWDMYLHTLAEYLEHFRGRPVAYVTADAPAESATESAWPVLLAALGLTGSTAPGDGVRLTPEGMAPIEGVTDYVGPTFLGVRTGDAMYRFHGRATLGMPIAVGHHLFREDVDVEREAEAWRFWFARVFAGAPAPDSRP
jgi:hypothetical protein